MTPTDANSLLDRPAPAADPLAPRLRALRRSPLVALICRRFAALVFLVLAIATIAFVLTHLVPGDPVQANIGIEAAANPDVVATYRERYGFNDPLPTQYVHYLQGLLHGDLGESIQTHNAVSHDLATFIPATVELAVLAVLIGALVGVSAGVVAALHRNRPADQVLRVISLLGISMPIFWIGLVALYVFFYKLGWFPSSGRLDPGVVPPPHVTGLYTVDALLAGRWGTFWSALHHLILPALVLASSSVALLTRFTRSAVLEVIEKDYVRAARAKGLRERRVVIGHVLRAALPSVVTVVGLVFANVLTGAIIVEYIFGFPGMGKYAFQSATTLDLPAIMGTSMFVAVVYVTINFVVDVLYGVIDPRMRVS